MGKVLVIRKPDRSIHQTLLSNGPAMKAFSRKLPADKQWKFEEMDQEDADKLPAIDPHFVTGAQAVAEVGNLKKENQAKDQKIEDLMKELEELRKGKTPVAPVVKQDRPVVNIVKDPEPPATVVAPGMQAANEIAPTAPVAKPIAAQTATGTGKKKSGPKSKTTAK